MPLTPILPAETLTGIVPASADAPASAVAEDGLILRHMTPDQWDQSLADFDGVCHEQLCSFAAARRPDVKCEAVGIYKDAELVAGALMMIKFLPLGLGAIAVSKWGPVLKDYNRDDVQEIFKGTVDALIGEYAERRGMMLSLQQPAPRPPFEGRQELLLARGFREGPQFFIAPDRYIVNLRLSDDELKKSFSQKWRYHLKKAMKEELEFEHASSDRFEEFETLYRAMLTRKTFDDQSAYDDTIDILMELKNAKLRPEIFFVRHEGEVIAGALIFKSGDTTEYLYGATNDKALRLRAGYFLQWHIARWLRDNTNARWYDLGGTKNVAGLHQFKKGMVGNKGMISPIPPVANYASRFWPALFGTSAFAVRDAVAKAKRAIEGLRNSRSPE